MKSGIGITTYFCKDTPSERYDIFIECVKSLIHTTISGPIFIVDDGSTDKSHLHAIRCLEYEKFIIIEKPINSGIAKAKNTCIKYILEAGCNVGFLTDDDVIFNEGWEKAYTDVMTATGIHHMAAWNGWSPHPKSCVKSVNGVSVIQSSEVNGYFLAFTKELIQKVGYFKVLPYKYGHEHSNFSVRCVAQKMAPFFCDIVDSNKYINVNEKSKDIRSIGNINEREFRINEQFVFTNSTQYEQCIE